MAFALCLALAAPGAASPEPDRVVTLTFDEDSYTVREGDSEFSFTVRLNGCSKLSYGEASLKVQTLEDASAQYPASGDLDFDLGVVADPFFGGNNPSVTMRVSDLAKADEAAGEGPETFKLMMYGLEYSPEIRCGGQKVKLEMPEPTVTVEIQDANPRPRVLLTGSAVSERQSGLSFFLALDRPGSRNVELGYRAFGGKDCDELKGAELEEDFRPPSSDTYVFQPGEVGPVRVDIPIVDDSRVETDEMVCLVIDRYPNALVEISSARATGTILNDDLGVSLLKIEGDGQVRDLGEQLLQPLVVRVTENGLPRAREQIRWAADPKSGALVLGSQDGITSTDAQGFARARIQLGNSPGAVTITAFLDRTNQSVSFSARAGDQPPIFDPSVCSNLAVLDEEQRRACTELPPWMAGRLPVPTREGLQSHQDGIADRLEALRGGPRYIGSTGLSRGFASSSAGQGSIGGTDRLSPSEYSFKSLTVGTDALLFDRRLVAGLALGFLAGEVVSEAGRERSVNHDLCLSAFFGWSSALGGSKARAEDKRVPLSVQVTGSFTLGRGKISARRKVDLSFEDRKIRETVQANPTTSLYGSNIAIGIEHSFGDSSLRASASVGTSSVKVHRYREHGLPDDNFVVDAHQLNSTLTQAGLEASHTHYFTQGALQGNLRADYLHESSASAQIRTWWAGAPDKILIFNPPQPTDRDFGRIRARLLWKSPGIWTTYLSLWSTFGRQDRKASAVQLGVSLSLDRKHQKKSKKERVP
jgi:hypothetical protein